jgi:hypothetical protein
MLALMRVSVKCFMWQEKKGCTGASAEYVIQDIFPLPRSLTRYARSFDCGERKWLTNGAEISWKMPGRYLTGK